MGQKQELLTEGYDMKTSEVINKAADSLERDGWQQGGLGLPGGPRCAMGALKTVLGEETVVVADECAAYGALRGHVGTWISDWNDTPERTAEEVIAAFRATALIEAAKENAEALRAIGASR